MTGLSELREAATFLKQENPEAVRKLRTFLESA